MDELIERLEKATGPNFALEQDIWCEIFAPDAVAIPLDLKPPSYTASIDAALTLVPKGSTWDLTFDDYLIACVGNGHNTGKHDTTPAIALCIAALKARKAAQT